MKFFLWLKTLGYIVKHHPQILKEQQQRFELLEKRIKDLTTISVDLGYRHDSQVIVTGRYRNTDYVQIFSLSDSDLPSIIARLREVERYGTVRRVDCARDMRAVFAREFRI